MAWVLFSGGDIEDGVPEELDEFVEGVLAEAFDVGVPAVFGEFGFVEAGADAIGLDAFGAELGEVGGTGDHAGDGDGVGARSPSNVRGRE